MNNWRKLKRSIMKPDNYTTPPKFDKTKWDIIFGKLKKLGTAIEMYYGTKMNI